MGTADLHFPGSGRQGRHSWTCTHLPGGGRASIQLEQDCSELNETLKLSKSFNKTIMFAY